MLHFDLRMPIIPLDQPVYMLHPGKNYHLFDSFKEYKCVSTDLPNLEINNGSDPLSRKNIDLQIKRARAMRDWLALNETERKKESYSTDEKDYFDKEKKTILTKKSVAFTIPTKTPYHCYFGVCQKNQEYLCQIRPLIEKVFSVNLKTDNPIE